MKELRIKRNDPQLSEIQRGGLKAFEMLFRQYYVPMVINMLTFTMQKKLCKTPFYGYGKTGKT